MKKKNAVPKLNRNIAESMIPAKAASEKMKLAAGPATAIRNSARGLSG